MRRPLRKTALASILFAGALLAVTVTVEAQQPTKVPRIGFLGNSTAALEENLVEPFRQGLHDLGYVEGKNILIEYRWAEGKYDRFPALIGELVAQKVDIIVTAGTPASLAVTNYKNNRQAAHWYIGFKKKNWRHEDCEFS